MAAFTMLHKTPNSSSRLTPNRSTNPPKGIDRNYGNQTEGAYDKADRRRAGPHLFSQQWDKRKDDTVTSKVQGKGD